MLDNPHQIAAYKLLQATPIHTANSIVQAGAVNVSAQAKAAALTALLLPAVTYPSTISTQVTKLTNWIALLNRIAASGSAFKNTISQYQTPTEMIELYLGWQVYTKVNELPDTTPIRTNVAVADTATVQALRTAVESLNLTAITSAWQAVNTALTPSDGGSGSSGGTGTEGTTAPGLSPAQISALTATMTDADEAYESLAAKVSAVDSLTANAKTDADLAFDAFHRAVDVAVLTNIASTDILDGSLQAIVSPATYNELKSI